MYLKDKAKQFKIKLPAIYLALKKKATPASAKIMAFLTIGYALSPIDLIPDFIPVLGYLDDVILLPLFIGLTIHLIPVDIMENCEKEAKDLWKDGKPKKWYYAFFVLLTWLLIICILVRIFK